MAHASVEEIDRLNIFQRLAARHAPRGGGASACSREEAWVDGNQLPGLLCKTQAPSSMAMPLHPVISAASILAKTARDAEMCALHARFPQYGFDRHKGYATAEHLDALGRLGPCEIHRRSFHAVGVFFQKDLFSDSWGAMAEILRVRSYRMYCDARKLAAGCRADASSNSRPGSAACVALTPTCSPAPRPRRRPTSSTACCPRPGRNCARVRPGRNGTD